MNKNELNTIINLKYKLDTLPEALKKQYYESSINTWSHISFGDAETFYNKALQFKAEQQFDKKILKQELSNFYGWLSIRCSVCDTEVEEAVYISWDDNFDIPTVLVCEKCLQKKLNLFKKEI